MLGMVYAISIKSVGPVFFINHLQDVNSVQIYAHPSRKKLRISKTPLGIFNNCASDG